MKKNKLTNNGFALIETLIVTVFVMTIFAFLYNSFYPLIGEYEKRESYDDIDGKYAAYWIKKFIENDNSYIPTLNTPPIATFSCTNLNTTQQKYCTTFVSSASISNMYITKYNLTDLQTAMPQLSNYSGGMHRYIANLPAYNIPSLNKAEYRIILEFKRNRNGEEYYAYSTFEVIK